MKPERQAFALVLTLALLSTLVLVVLGLGALNRAGADMAYTGVAQLRAQQHALLGLDAAVAELQRLAGEDDVLTGMGGITGIPAGAGNPARHWCGVWGAGGDFRGWLASGATGAAIPALGGVEACEILGDGALGADGTDKEHVRTLALPVLVDAPGGPVRLGSVAWWVGDEGVKLSAVIAPGSAAVTGGVHAIDEIVPALDPLNPNLARVIAYAQLALAPNPVLTPGQLQSNLHALTVTHERVDAGGATVAGLLNVNSTSVRFWRGIAATYNRWRPADADALAPTLFGPVLRDEIPAGDPMANKPSGTPYRTVDDFLNSAALAEALNASGGTPSDFAAVMRPWLTTRSDTFRVRAFGNARNAVDENKVEAVAWCEAIVQRTGAPLPGFGRRFEVRYFRWLGPDDL